MASQPAPAPVFQRAITGHSAAALSQPHGVALDASGNLWVADTGHSRVEEFSPSGSYLASISVATPTAPAGTPDEYVAGLPIGLGFRVPCTIVSPWTAGGRVHSGVLDHTSLIRFIEAQFGVREPSISAWRRQTCGDFTSAFRFGGQPARYPAGNSALSLAAAEAGLLTAQREVNDFPAPVIPKKNQPLPRQ